MNQINKMKNIVAKNQKNEQKLNGELKTANQEIKKLTIRIDQLTKQSIKNKDTLNETIGSLMGMKKSLPLPSTIGMKDSTYLNPKNLASSRVIGHKSYDNMASSETFDMRRIV